MAKREEGMFEQPKTQANKPSSANDVLISVMPKEFFGRDAGIREGQVAAAPAVIPPPKPAAPVPLAPPVPVKRTRGSRLPLVLLGVGAIMLALLVVGGYYILEGIDEEQEVIVAQPPVAPAPQEPVEEDPEPQQPVITAGRDTDSDGLTDREEALYGTDFRNPDTDGDSFLDGNEVFHGYDPLGYSPSTLLDTGSVIQYSAAEDAYELTYPRTWTLSTSMDGLSLRSATGTSVEVLAQPKDPALSFEDWYLNVYAREGEDVRVFQEGRTKAGYITHVSPDKMETFVVFDEVVYVFVYNLGSSVTIDYLQTFQMIINSFVVNE